MEFYANEKDEVYRGLHLFARGTIYSQEPWGNALMCFCLCDYIT